MKKKILFALVILFIGIQFIRPAKNQSADAMVNDISTVYNKPNEVSAIMDKACNDCHSNNTVYPWYAQVQPVAWWLNDHIVEGKDELNFNEFATYSIARQYKKLEEIAEEVKEDEMPLYSYTIIHTNAKLSTAEKLTLTNWCNNLRDSIKANYPADSLIIKRPPQREK